MGVGRPLEEAAVGQPREDEQDLPRRRGEGALRDFVQRQLGDETFWNAPLDLETTEKNTT